VSQAGGSAGLPPSWPQTYSVRAGLFERMRQPRWRHRVLIVKSYPLKGTKRDGLGEDRRDG
jgi:hypothetical protein